LVPVPVGPAPVDERDERDEVRRLLSHAAQVAMGVSDPASLDGWTTGNDLTPAPSRVTVADIEQIEHVTAGLRALDYQFGGGACRDAVLAQTRWVARFLDADATDDVRRRIHLTLADLHNLTGWTSLDLGLYSASRRHFAHALTHSRYADEPSLLANVLYRTGRLHLHREQTPEALRFFQLGQIAAQDSGDPSLHLDPAIGALTRAVAARDAHQARSQAFEVTALAVATLRTGDHQAGIALGWDAVTAAEQLSSRRVLDRLEPLALEAARTATSDAEQLAQAITTLRCA
jgi:hypothetical protein